MNYYRGQESLPYHLSVGAVILNDQKEVLCHYFPKNEFWSQNYRDFYILMRETVEPGESLEQAVTRGCHEEFGAKVEIKDFLGSIVSSFPSDRSTVQKTTLYFLCQLIELDSNQRKADDPEKNSRVVWQPIEELIPKMKQQGRQLKRSDLDESEVLERILELL